METILERGKIAKPFDPVAIEVEQANLAKEADHYLGYQRLHNKVWQKSSVSERTRSAVETATKAFGNVGLEPLTDKSVLAYQAEKIKIHERKYLWRNFCCGDNGIGTAAVCVFGSFACCVVWVVTMALADLFKAHHVINVLEWMAPVYFRILGLVFLAWPVIGVSRLFLDKTSYRFSWSKNELKYYSQEVPQFALAHAVALAKEVPGAEFYIESFERSDSRSYPDPFLLMRIQGVDFYVDVWEEPKFEARKTV